MRFSIVTITKNNPNGFGKTKQSVESQSFSDFEWIVIDGDKEPDNGIYDAMNKGLKKAKGDYIIFMNAGDEFADTDTLQILAGYDADFIYGAGIEGGHIKKAKPLRFIKSGMITHHQAMVYKRSVLSALLYDEQYNLAADYKFTLEFIDKVRTVTRLPVPICIFEQGGVSQRHAAISRQQEQAIRNELGVHSPFTPYRQWLAHLVKTYCPWIYLKIRMIAQ